MFKLLLPILLISSFNLHAQTFNVSTTPELRQALFDAASNSQDDTILIANGTYKTSDDGAGTFSYIAYEGNTLTIIGSDKNSCILDGNSESQIFQGISTQNFKISFSNLTFSNGSIFGDDGGAIYVDSSVSNLDVYNSIFLNNYASSTGGAISARGGRIYTSILNSSFIGNTSDHYGGAIGGAYLDIKGSTFDQNTADSGGGGAVDSSNIFVEDSVFKNNTAYEGGGFNSSGTASVINSEFTNNVATGSGGGLISRLSSTVLNSKFVNNSAYSGGAIYSNYHNGNGLNQVENSIFINNVSTFTSHEDVPNGYGSAIYSEDIKISNSIFMGSIDNSAILLGGIDNVISNSIFIENNFNISGQSTSAVKLYNNYIDTTKVDITLPYSDNFLTVLGLGFTDIVNYDFTLLPTSPFIDSGMIAFDIGNIDLNGNPRVSGESIDIGPYEFISTNDSDNDLIIDSVDNCVTTINTDQSDFDTDGAGDACDTDDDNDGVSDIDDAFPLDASESVDTDGDGMGNSIDTDDDNDGVIDTDDSSPLDASESTEEQSSSNTTSSAGGGGSLNLLFLMIAIFIQILSRGYKIAINS